MHGCAVLFSAAQRKVKIKMLGAAVIAAVVFIPWLAIEYTVYVGKKGLGANLSWQGVPSWYDLKAIWAAYIGIPPLPGGTTLVVVAAFAVIAAGLWASRRSASPLRTLFLWTTVLCALLLALRSLYSYAGAIFHPDLQRAPCTPVRRGLSVLLLSDSAAILVRRSRFPGSGMDRLRGGSGDSTALPTVRDLRQLPRRVPFSGIAAGLNPESQFYSTWMTGIGHPLYFHSRDVSTSVLFPLLPAEIPRQLAVLFRQQIERENRQIEELTKMAGK